ncbi:hypothetical protein LRAMOSA02775 [Lichtheimia ramosa]|uniref:MARVEL domain-containing protein n=1 Tax=Lichtheimia ramosa TaxID=688394 RepID=A0A077WSP8_9FUNG|nr:hypothetical protein LRAMOSA02775 [Lichtheimia ramosa]
MIHKCCCCFPLRIGVFIIALFSFLASTASLVWLIINRNQIQGYEGYSYFSMDVVFYVGIGLASLNIAAGLFGLIGTTAQKRGLVVIFQFVYWIMAILTLVVTVGTWIFLLVHRSDIEAGCQEGVEQMESSGYTLGSEIADMCSRGMQGLLIGGGVGVFIGNIISLYFACVVSAYASRLKRSNQHLPLRDLEDFPQPAYKTAY